jgi:hypothetical protein
MIVTLHEQRARGRRRLWWGAAKIVLALVVVGGTFVVAHRLGRETGGREVNGLRQEIAVLNATVADLQAQPAAAPAPADSSATVSRQVEDDAQAGAALLDGLLARIAELEAIVAQQPAADSAPAAGPAAMVAPDLQEMFGLVQDKLDQGVTLARLRSAIEGVARERSCEEAADSRRFVVQTAARRDEANGSVTFTDGITVSAEGAVPEGAEGRAGLRYDPEQPVTVRFAIPDAAPSEVSGMLPLEHSLIRDGQELLFTAEAGDPGFLRITRQVCAYP